MKTPLYFSCSSNKEDTVFAWFPFIWNPAVWDALYTNCLYVASTGTLSSVNSSLLWVIRNSTRNIDSRWDVLPSFDLSYDARVFTLGWCIFAPRHVHSSGWGKLSLRAVLFFRQHQFLDCCLTTFTHSRFPIGINNPY